MNDKDPPRPPRVGLYGDTEHLFDASNSKPQNGFNAHYRIYHRGRIWEVKQGEGSCLWQVEAGGKIVAQSLNSLTDCHNCVRGYKETAR